VRGLPRILLFRGNPLLQSLRMFFEFQAFKVKILFFNLIY
jgi:hypothetical protein